MDWMSKETLGLLYFLLPGFMAAWIFYGLTAHPKREAFERIVQALIFTAIIQAVTSCIRYVLLLMGKKCFAVGPWTEESRLIWSVIVAAVIGIGFSSLANSNSLHLLLQRWKVTKRTSYPGEWYSAFHRFQRYCVLHLKDGRRMRGWPDEWPDQSDHGHFLMQHPAWVLDTGERIPLYQTERMLIAATDVERVEFEYNMEELTLTTAQMAEAQKPLIEIHKRKETQDGKQSTSTST